MIPVAYVLLTRFSHNRLPTDTVLSEVDVLILSSEFKDLCAIIASHNAQDSFRLRLLHRHMPISEGHILLGTDIQDASDALGCWTTPSLISKIDLHNIHGHIFVVDTTSDGHGHLFPVEFREGPPPNILNVDYRFYSRFADYLRTNGLENTFGLEAIQGQAKKTIEFSFDTGNLLLDEVRVKPEVIVKGGGQFKLQDTVWSVTVRDGIVQYTTGETRCVSYTTGHVKVTESKSGLDVMKILADEGVLAM